MNNKQLIEFILFSICIDSKHSTTKNILRWPAMNCLHLQLAYVNNIHSNLLELWKWTSSQQTVFRRLNDPDPQH